LPALSAVDEFDQAVRLFAGLQESVLEEIFGRRSLKEEEREKKKKTRERNDEKL
jgi:hypothetical protein